MKFLSIAESLGAFAVLLGLLTPWAAGGLAMIMLGVIYKSLADWNIGFVTPTGAGWNFPLAILGGCFILVAFGAGTLSIDWVKNTRKKNYNRN